MAAAGTSRRTRRMAPTSCVTVSWVATASSSVESNAHRCRPAKTLVWAINRPHRLEDPLRPVRGPKPAAPQGQHRGMKALVGQGQPAGNLPSDVLPKLRARLPIRQPLQRLQHHDRGHLIGRDRRPTTTRREQVSEQLVREQLLAVIGQEGKYRARIDQVAAHGGRVQQLDARGVICPLHEGSLPQHPPASWGLRDLFAQQPPRAAAARLVEQRVQGLFQVVPPPTNSSRPSQSGRAPARPPEGSDQVVRLSASTRRSSR
jgi:hypothetical protein